MSFSHVGTSVCYHEPSISDRAWTFMGLRVQHNAVVPPAPVVVVAVAAVDATTSSGTAAVMQVGGWFPVGPGDSGKAIHSTDMQFGQYTVVLLNAYIPDGQPARS